MTIYHDLTKRRSHKSREIALMSSSGLADPRSVPVPGLIESAKFLSFERLLHITDGVMRRLHDVVRQKPLPIAKPPVSARIKCREIDKADLNNVINLLTTGFDRRRNYWVNAINRLTAHPTPEGYPKYGYLLEGDGIIVGVLLAIFTARVENGVSHVRCNGSSLYVEPSFSSFAPFLLKRTERFKGVTYLNITPSKRTWPMMTAHGYRRFANGIFVSWPRFTRSLPNVSIEMMTARDGQWLQPFETELLLAHQDFGCLSLICKYDGKIYPFVFGVYKKHGVRLAHLIYCRDQSDFVLLAGSLGRFLTKRGFPIVILDSNGSVPGLLGRFLLVRPKYWHGADAPKLGDLAYTERVMFGF